jgi:(p)ppGpp synthase/HD superfamily hydrolase
MRATSVPDVNGYSTVNTDSMLTQSDLARAITLASIAHGEQIDKSGKAYILHPLRVMQRCDEHGIDAQIVAVLHDVVEDTWMDLDLLRAYGFPDTIIDAVDAITQRPGEETYEEYIRRCSRNKLAALVKLADLDDNSDPVRRFGRNFDSRLQRYASAREIIRQELNPEPVSE